MKGHADAEILAAYREGLLPRRRAARVAAHLAGCPRCTEANGRLAEVTSLLSASPAPPMPAALAARIGAALAAEAAARAAAEPGQAPVGQPSADGPSAARPGPAVPAHGRDRRGRASRRGAASPRPVPPSPGPRPGGPSSPRRRSRGRSWLSLRAAAVTAAVAVVAGGGYGVAQLISQGAPLSTSASSAGAPGPNHGPAASGSKLPARFPGSYPAPANGAANRLPVIASGTRYRQQRLGAQVRAVLARFGSRRTAASAGNAGTEPRSFREYSLLQACVLRVTGGRAPELVDVATYRGHPAAVIMLAIGTGRVRAWVVGPACSGSAADVLASTTVLRAG